MKRVWIVTAGVVLVLLVGGGIAAMKLRQAKAAPPGGAAYEPVEAAEIVSARQISWQQTADLVGTVFAMRSVIARNELPGVVRFVGFTSGDVVEAGQVLLRQDDASDRADLEAVKASVRVAEANVAQMESQIKLAESELERMGGAQKQAVAAMELDRARTKVETFRTDRDRWRAEVDQAKARVAQVQARLDKLVIKAPFRARAGMRNIHEGQYLAEGVDIVQLEEVTDDIYLDFAIPQQYSPRARVGMEVLATSDVLGAEPVKIKVVAIDAIVNRDTRNLRIRALVKNPGGALVPGMSVPVRVPIDEPRSFVVVPSTAVRRAAYGTSVFVVAPDEGGGAMRAHQRFVTLGQALDEDVIVLEGLKEGEQVAAAGSFKLRDKAKVMTAPPAAAAGAAPAGSKDAAAGQDAAGPEPKPAGVTK